MSTPYPVADHTLKAVLSGLRNAGPQGMTKEQLRRLLDEAEPQDSACSDGPSISQARAKALDKKIERCLLKLEADGAKIGRKRTPQRCVCFQLTKGPKWDEHVSHEARLALKLAALSLTHSGTLLWQEKLEVIEQIADRHMSNRDHLLFDELEKAVKIYGGVDDPVVSGTEEILEPLLSAISQKRLVAIEHQTASARTSVTRQFVPVAITHDLFSGGAYLMAWDPRKHTPKHFRLNRISRVEVLKERGVVTHPERMERALRYQIGAWCSADEPFEVSARIRGASWIASLKEAPPALPDFTSKPEDGGKSLLIHFKANTMEGPIRWLLQFGACAEILGPPELQERIQEELQAALSQLQDRPSPAKA